MSNLIQEKIKEIQTKIVQLIKNYQKIKQENKELNNKLQEKEIEIKRLKNEIQSRTQIPNEIKFTLKNDLQLTVLQIEEIIKLLKNYG